MTHRLAKQARSLQPEKEKRYAQRKKSMVKTRGRFIPGIRVQYNVSSLHGAYLYRRWAGKGEH